MRVITADNLKVCASVPALPGADAGLIALGVGQHPERGRRGIGEQCAPSGERCGDPRLGGVMRHIDVEVDPVALRPWRIHLLEPDRGATSVRVDQAAGQSQVRRQNR